MSRAAGAPSRQLLERQRNAAERLRRVVMGVDGSLDHPYFRALRRSCRAYRRNTDLPSILDRAERSGLVLIGDFHAVPAYVRFAAELIEALHGRGRRVCLGIEFVFTRQQRLLLRRQAGEIDDATFQRRMHYRDEWGYPWEGYRDLLDRARDLEIDVEALDLPPRVGFDGLRRRDAHAGRRIAELIRTNPERCMVVLYGESHLTPTHLPADISRALARFEIHREPLVVFQNPDRLYWQRVAERADPSLPLEIDDRAVAVFHTTPLEKYEAYRQVLERWQSDRPEDEEIDLTPAVHHLIGVLARGIGIRPGRRRVRHRAGWSEELIDAYPEVYSGPEARELLAPILLEHGRNDAEIADARGKLDEVGALYEPRSNTVFLTRYVPGPAAGEAASFLRAALTGRLFIAPRDFGPDKSQTAYGAAYNEALTYLGARLVDPTCDFGPGMRQAGAGSGPTGGAPDAGSWIEAHRRFERSAEPEPNGAMLEALRASRNLRRALARDLGARLGAKLVDRVRSGKLDPAGLRRLFTRPLRPAHAARDLLHLIRD